MECRTGQIKPSDINIEDSKHFTSTGELEVFRVTANQEFVAIILRHLAFARTHWPYFVTENGVQGYWIARRYTDKNSGPSQGRFLGKTHDR